MFKKEKIIELLNAKGWSQYRLCKEANMTQSTLSDILSGRRKNPTAATLQKIATALGVSVDEFFEDESDKIATTSLDNDDLDLRVIERARRKMSPKDKERMMQILKLSFEGYFDKEDDEDNDK